MATKNHVKNADVVVHESIHALRKFDKDRDPRLKAVKHYFGNEADLEESLTEAETTGREKPFSRGKEYTAGYYHYIKIPNKTSKDMVIEDRVTLTGDVEKGKKGKRVQKTVLLQYPKLNIAKLKNKGASEAIDTFYEIEREMPGGGGGDKTGVVKTEAHFYNPSGNEKTDAELDEKLKSETTGTIKQATDAGSQTIQRSRTVEKFKRPGQKTTKKRTSQPKGSPGTRFGPYKFRGGRLSK